MEEETSVSKQRRICVVLIFFCYKKKISDLEVGSWPTSPAADKEFRVDKRENASASPSHGLTCSSWKNKKKKTHGANRRTANGSMVNFEQFRKKAQIENAFSYFVYQHD